MLLLYCRRRSRLDAIAGLYHVHMHCPDHDTWEYEVVSVTQEPIVGPEGPIKVVS